MNNTRNRCHIQAQHPNNHPATHMPRLTYRITQYRNTKIENSKTRPRRSCYTGHLKNLKQQKDSREQKTSNKGSAFVNNPLGPRTTHKIKKEDIIISFDVILKILSFLDFQIIQILACQINKNPFHTFLLYLYHHSNIVNERTSFEKLL